jgi:hypothetical protein
LGCCGMRSSWTLGPVKSNDNVTEAGSFPQMIMLLDIGENYVNNKIVAH